MPQADEVLLGAAQGRRAGHSVHLVFLLGRADVDAEELAVLVELFERELMHVVAGTLVQIDQLCVCVPLLGQQGSAADPDVLVAEQSRAPLHQPQGGGQDGGVDVVEVELMAVDPGMQGGEKVLEQNGVRFLRSPLPISSLMFSTVSERAARSSCDIRKKTSASRFTVGETWA